MHEEISRVSRSERKKELARRRHRRAKIHQLQRRAESASQSEKAVIADKIRQLTPGCAAVIDKLGLEER
jgi:hypothetical protein